MVGTATDDCSVHIRTAPFGNGQSGNNGSHGLEFGSPFDFCSMSGLGFWDKGDALVFGLCFPLNHPNTQRPRAGDPGVAVGAASRLDEAPETGYYSNSQPAAE